MFSSLVLSQWVPDDVRRTPVGEIAVSVDPALPANRSVSLLRLDNGRAVLSVSPERASGLELVGEERVDAADLARRMERSGISFNDPDHLFYLTLEDQAVLHSESPGPDTRQLSASDAAMFDALTNQAPEDDLDEAFVELDHWLVLGTFINDTLVSAASMYPWSGTHLADLGVITLPAFRGRGLGRVTVRAMSAEALRRGYEPQYRCQLDNPASVTLARAAGFTRLGSWEVIDTGQ